MADKISEEMRHKIIQRMIIIGNAAQVDSEFNVSESSVRNIMTEVREGRYPEYEEFIPHLKKIVQLSQELESAGRTVQQAADGLAIAKGVWDLGLEPTSLPPIVKVLKETKSNAPSVEFGRAIVELVKLHTETHLSFDDLTKSILQKKSELTNLLTQVKTTQDEIDDLEAKKTQATNDLEKTFKKRDVTIHNVEEYLRDKQVLVDADLSLKDMQLLALFVRAAKSEGFLGSAKELASLESETGMNFKTIVREYQTKRDGLEKYRVEEKNHLAQIAFYTNRIADLKKEEANQLSTNNITKQQLERHLSLVDRLSKAGINFED
jgi:hypothetical protein